MRSIADDAVRIYTMWMYVLRDSKSLELILFTCFSGSEYTAIYGKGYGR